MSDRTGNWSVRGVGFRHPPNLPIRKLDDLDMPKSLFDGGPRPVHKTQIQSLV